MCDRLDLLLKKRFMDEMQSNRKSINKDFMKDVAPTKAPEEVLQENTLPMQARRFQNFVKQSSTNNEALVEIMEAEEPSITIPPRQKISDKPTNIQKNGKELQE